MFFESGLTLNCILTLRPFHLYGIDPEDLWPLSMHEIGHSLPACKLPTQQRLAVGNVRTHSVSRRIAPSRAIFIGLVLSVRSSERSQPGSLGIAARDRWPGIPIIPARATG